MKESDIQRSILDYLAAKHIMAFRMNTGAMSAEHNGKKRFMRFGTPGMADILAFRTIGEFVVTARDTVLLETITYRGVPASLPTWIECKAPKGKQSELQKSFQQQVELEGHIYILAHSLDDVIAVIG